MDIYDKVCSFLSFSCLVIAFLACTRCNILGSSWILVLIFTSSDLSSSSTLGDGRTTIAAIAISCIAVQKVFPWAIKHHHYKEGVL